MTNLPRLVALMLLCSLAACSTSRFKGKVNAPHIYLLSTLSANDGLTVAQFFVAELCIFAPTIYT